MKEYTKELTKCETLQGYLYIDANIDSSIIESPTEFMVAFDDSEVYESFKYNSISKRLFGLSDWYQQKNAKVYDTVYLKVDEDRIHISYTRKNGPLFPSDISTDSVPREDDFPELIEFFDPSDVGHGKEDYTRREIIGLFLREYHNVFIKAVSRYYPLNEYLLAMYEDEWNWSHASQNERIPFSNRFIRRFSNKWNWFELSLRTDLPWSEEIIQEFDYAWDWQCISENNSIPWTVDLMDEYRDKILWSLERVEYEDPYDAEGFLDPRLEDVYYPRKTICSNPNVAWDVNLVKKYIEYIDLSELCKNPGVEWSDELVGEFKNQLDWATLCSGNNIKWTDDNIQKFMDFIDWRALSRNRKIRWNEETIEKYDKKIDWSELSANPSLDVSLEFVKVNENKFDWSKLSANSGNLNTTRAYSFACRFESNIDWRVFSANTRVYWDWELVDKLMDRLDWDEFSRNPAVAGIIVLIEDFETRVNWKRFSENIGVDFTNDLVIKNKDKWDWEILLQNPEFSMTVEIEKECSNHLRFWHSKKILYKLSEHSPSDFVSKQNNNLRHDESFMKDFSMLENLPWTLQYLLRKVDFEPEEFYDGDYRRYLRMNGIGVGENRAIWERVFSPFVDDELIERVMSAHGVVPKKPKHLSDEDDEPLPF